MGVEPKKPTTKGPAEWFTGDVWIDGIRAPGDDWPVNIGHVHFTPGARTAWHHHDGGQTLYVTEGRGLAQNRGEDAVELRPGDVHVTAHAQEHWHGAAHDHLMSHITVTPGQATWGDHVTDEDYRRANGL